MNVTRTSFIAIQQATECHMVGLFEDASKLLCYARYCNALCVSLFMTITQALREEY